VSPKVGGVVGVVGVFLPSCAFDVLADDDNGHVAGVYVVAAADEGVNDSLHYSHAHIMDSINSRAFW